MSDRDSAPGSVAEETFDRDRATAFSEALRTVLQRQNYYSRATDTYDLPRLFDQISELDSSVVHIATLRSYLRGEVLPSDSRVRLMADALEVPRGVLLYAAGYLTATDLPNYPGPNTTMEALDADIAEVESLPLMQATKDRILHDLRTSKRILRLLVTEREFASRAIQPSERELVVEQLIELWMTPPPPPPARTGAEEMQQRRPVQAPAPQLRPSPPVAPVAEPAPVPVKQNAASRV